MRAGGACPPLARGDSARSRAWRAPFRRQDLAHAADAAVPARRADAALRRGRARAFRVAAGARSEEHTSELQSLMRISSAVFCLKKQQLPPCDAFASSINKRATGT